MDNNQAIQATRNGAIAAVVSAALTAVVVLIAVVSDADGDLAFWSNPLNFIDVGLLLIFAWGVFKKSRVAAVLLVAYFLASKIIIAIEAQSYSGIGVSLIFLYFYGRAVQGSFVYHKLVKAENPDYKPTKKWAYIVGIPPVALVIFLIGFGLLSTVGVVPSTRVLYSDEIRKADIEVLVDRGIVPAEDKVEYFYSQGFLSILESGNVLTDNRVILYYTDEYGELLVYEIPVDDVVDVSLEYQGNYIDDSVYLVSTNDPEWWLKLFLSTEQKGDEKFVNALRSRVNN